MTKLVVALAVVVVVIVVVVIVAARNLRAEDPEEFADRRSRGRPRGGQSGREQRYDRRRPAEWDTRDTRPSGASGRPAPRQAVGSSRPAGAGASRGPAEHRDRYRASAYEHLVDQAERTQRIPPAPRVPSAGPPPPAREDRGAELDRDFGHRAGRGRDDRRGAHLPPLPEGRRGDGATKRRSPERRAPAGPRQARGRRTDDSAQWDSSEWEKLSDVDYWAELAADRPLTATAQSATEHLATEHPATEHPATHRPAPSAAELLAPQQAELLASQQSAAELPAPQHPVGQRPEAQQPAPRRSAARHSAAQHSPAQQRPPAQHSPAQHSGARHSAARHQATRHQAARPEVAPATTASGASATVAPAIADRTGFALTPLPVSGTQDVPLGAPTAEPAALPLPRHAGPASLPGPVYAIPQDPLRTHADDDPLTSPFFATVPASGARPDARGRINTPAGGSRPPAHRLEPTQEYARYGASAPQPGVLPTQAAGLPGDGSKDVDRAGPQARWSDPLLSQNSHPGHPVSPPPGWLPTSGAVGNPYGSYVTSGAQPTASGYGDHAAMPGNGNESYPRSGVTAGPGPASGEYWQPSAPGHGPGPDVPAYLGGASVHDLRGADGQAVGYVSSNGQYGAPGYLPSSYADGPRGPAGCAQLDRYGHEGYGGYRGYGAPWRP